MRATRVLTIAVILGIALSFQAFAKVVYDSESTNVWFQAVLSTYEKDKSPWSGPENGEAVVESGHISLDTDLDDPLTYTATDASADVAVVAAEMTATVNATPPQLDPIPQAALAVIGDATAAKWTGLVGKEGGGTEWVTFPTPIPVAGESYSVRIEFDQRVGMARRIRYLVDGVVLSGAGSADGWYPNPQTGTAKISNVSFSGSGDIKALSGESITENTLAFKGLTQTNGFDYTNGTIKISADIQGYENVKAVLKLVDFGTGSEKPPVEYSLGNNTPVVWNLSDLTAGGTYGYTIEAKDAGGNVITTKTGTFTAANWPSDIWFGADATGGGEGTVTGGSWDLTKEKPAVEGNAYVIEEDALFNVTDQKPGSNHVTRVDTKVTFETLVDLGSLETPEDDALGGFVAAKDGVTPQWMALTVDNGDPTWVALTGAPVPEVNVPYVIRAEVDFISDVKRVRFLVSDGTGETFTPLSYSGNQWIPLATQAKYSLAAVELKGSGKVAKFEATVANKALAKVGEVEYDSMDAALAVAADGKTQIQLLTNATIEPKEKGSYDIAPGAYQYVSGGAVSSEGRTIVVTESGQPPVVRPSEATMQAVQAPDGTHFKNTDTLRQFLENNKVPVYTSGNGSSTDISGALQASGQNGLPLWEDYVMGIEQTDSVTPEYTPSADKDKDNFNLQVPALGAAIRDHKLSGDYTIKYRVDEDGKTGTSVEMTDSGIIPVDLPDKAANFDVKIILVPVAD